MTATQQQIDASSIEIMINFGMSTTKGAVGGARVVVQAAQKAMSTPSKRAFTTAIATTTYRPIQQSISRRPGGYGRSEELRAFSNSPALLHNHLDPPKPGEE